MTEREEFDKHYLQAARSLASTLRIYAKDRREDDKKKIAVLQHELCQISQAEEWAQRKRK
jgi:hypothetical protein